MSAIEIILGSIVILSSIVVIVVVLMQQSREAGLSGAISGDYTDNTDVHKSFQLVVRPFLQLTKMTRIYAEAGWSVDSVDVKDKTKGKKVVEQAQK